MRIAGALRGVGETDVKIDLSGLFVLALLDSWRKWRQGIGQ
jgi:hypothetical protein